MTGPNEPIAYQIKDAAAVAGLSRSTLYKLAKQGHLPIRKVCGRSLIARSDLLNLLNLQ